MPLLPLLPVPLIVQVQVQVLVMVVVVGVLVVVLLVVVLLVVVLVLVARSQHNTHVIALVAQRAGLEQQQTVCVLGANRTVEILVGKKDKSVTDCWKTRRSNGHVHARQA